MNWEGVVKANFEPDVDRIESLDIGLVLPDGTTYYMWDEASTNLGDRAYVKQALAGKTTVSDVLISRATNKPVVMLAAPIFKDESKNAAVLGVVVARKDGPTFLTGLVNDIQTNYRTEYGFLINSEGTIIAHPDTELVNKQFNPAKEAEKDPSLKSLADMILIKFHIPPTAHWNHLKPLKAESIQCPIRKEISAEPWKSKVKEVSKFSTPSSNSTKLHSKSRTVLWKCLKAQRKLSAKAEIWKEPPGKLPAE
jgi:hypothetical protein